MTTVVDGEGRLEGIVTDGDLRRIMAARKREAFDLTAAECMTRGAVTLAPEELASRALNLMEERKITSIVVVDADRRVLGVVHIHDLWTLQLFSRDRNKCLSHGHRQDCLCYWAQQSRIIGSAPTSRGTDPSLSSGRARVSVQSGVTDWRSDPHR